MKEMTDYFELRADLYNLLSFPYYEEINAEYLNQLKKYSQVFTELTNQMPEDMEGSARLRGGLDGLKGYFDAAYPQDKALEELGRIFATLFLGVITGKSITPYESVYRSGRPMQDQRDEVLEIYCNEKIGKDSNFKEPEDHLCAELKFMSIMSQHTVAALETRDTERVNALIETQTSFHTEHLHKWISDVCRDVASLAKELTGANVYGSGNLFAAIADITEGFVVSDLHLLNGLFNTVEN